MAKCYKFHPDLGLLSIEKDFRKDYCQLLDFLTDSGRPNDRTSLQHFADGLRDLLCQTLGRIDQIDLSQANSLTKRRFDQFENELLTRFSGQMNEACVLLHSTATTNQSIARDQIMRLRIDAAKTVLTAHQQLDEAVRRYNDHMSELEAQFGE